ncbi:hypothetical protein RCG00_16965 [Thiothrix subterranea]|uniref:Uncharacterized protein n=1 Tax=Thiothrix subterranea TaxID=2735563 RepID=A0AA51MLP7_9GAMM|nr:hypothetical protein [Thiothrix subterranea]WML85979.1 hypothetical protein RCG00_16965 [Thiothrix subterranea]
MVEVFAFFIGSDFHLMQAEVDQINGDMQAVRRGCRTRFLHGRTVNDNEAEFAAIDNLA